MSKTILINGELPKKWASCSLDEISSLIRGITFPKTSKISHKKTGYIACLRTANIQDDVDWGDLWFVPEQYVKEDEKLVKLNDILISNANSLELVGKVSYIHTIPVRSTLGAFITTIRASPSIDPKFLFYQLRSDKIRTYLRSIASTTVNISNISTTKLSKIQLLIPPLNEQKRIVAKIEELFSLIKFSIRNLESAQKQITSYRKKILTLAFNGELTSTWRNLHQNESAKEQLMKILSKKINNSKKSHTHSDSIFSTKYNLNEIPDNWLWCTLDDVSSQITDGEHFNPKYVERGNLLLSAKNIRNGFVSYDDVHYVSDADFEKCLQRCSPKINDILVVSVGATTGRTAIVTKNIPFAVLRSVLLIRSSSIHPMYLLRYLQSPLASRWLTEASGSTAQAHLYIRDVKSFPFPMAPLQEQIQIARMIDEQFSIISDHSSIISEQLIRLKTLQHIILKQAFEGDLVAQDPNDEPAKTLLDKIKRERQQLVNATTKSREKQNGT